MIQVEDMGGYLKIWSDANKQICENNEFYWNATKDNPIAVDKGRFSNLDYVESENEIVEEVEDAIDEISE